MTEIRVTYSGLVSFAIGIASVLTGLIFTLIVTRELSQEEFGTWGLIGSLTTYVFIIEPIVSYWTIREIARGNESGRTALISNTMFSFGAVPIYFVIIIFFGTQGGVNQEILFFAALLIPVRFIRHTFAAINLGYRPQTIAYSLLVFELVKIALAFFLIYYMKLGLEGVILTIFFATIAGIIYSLVRTLEKIREKFDVKYLKKWLKLSWIPMYPRFADILLYSDVVVFTIIVGSVANIAYWASALAISGIVLHAGKISTAVYPKLLQGGKKEYFHQNLTRVFYFVFPLAGMALVFSKPGLFALNPIYEVAAPIVFSLTFLSISQIMSNIFSKSLRGLEKIDMNEKASFKDYMNSKLFRLPTIRIVQRGAYLGTLVVFLLFFSSYFNSDLELVYVWSIIAVISHIPYTIYLYILVRKDFKSNLDKTAIIKYLGASTISFSLTYFLMEKFLEYHESLFEFVPNFLPFVILGVGTYFGITYMIDSKTRNLVKSVIMEIKTK